MGWGDFDPPKIMGNVTLERQFMCTECGYRSFEKHGLRMHMKIHNKDHQEKAHKCSHCEYASIYKQQFVMHVKVKHDIDMPAVKRGNKWKGQCEQCGYSTLNRGNYSVHLRIHEREKRFKCDQCPYEANRKGLMETHKRSVHENLFIAINVSIRQPKKVI